MHSSIVSMIHSVLEFRFIRAIPVLTGDSSFISGNLPVKLKLKHPPGIPRVFDVFPGREGI